MEIVGYIFIGILIGVIILLIISINKKLKYEKECKEEYIRNKKKEFEEALKEENNVLLSVRKAREKEEQEFQKESEKQKQYLENRKKEVQELVNTQNQLLALKEEDLDKLVQSHYEQEQAEYERTMRAAINSLREDMTAQLTEEIEKGNATLDSLKEVIEEYQAKQNAINEQILRQRALDEQQDFYRICITSDDCEDIEILRSIRNKLHRTAFLDKIIYDTFVSKYVKEMAKRVLQGKDPSGIYKVTNIKTNEIYIGKSTNVATRWVNHTKSAYGLEGVADSQFQRALKQYGVQNFTWELVEAVPKDLLSTRERFYIEFYNTTSYGYNMRLG